MSEVVSFEDYHHPARPAVAGRAGKMPDVFFDRRELGQILNLYAMMVGAGEWRDYAIGHDPESCCFAVFRRSADMPLFRILKVPKLAKRQGAYAVLSAGGRVLKRGKTLGAALKIFKRTKLTVV